MPAAFSGTISLETDSRWMRLALAEARLGLGTTSPNPPVGAVIVSANGDLLGKGHHEIAGGPHAEIQALNAICPENLPKLSGGTAYVTLEPCSTHGRTPPCVQALIGAGLGRVVWAMDDPNPSHVGRAAAILAEKGIPVTRGVLAHEAQDLLRPWSCFMLKKRPYVIVKAGLSLDGRLTRPSGESQWLTSPASRQDAQRLRQSSDAILVGGATVRADNPAITIRPSHLKSPLKKQPWRIVWSRQPLPETCQLRTDEHQDRTLCLDSPTPASLLTKLHGFGVVQLLVEGGSQVITQFLTAGVVDELHLYLAPLISGSGRALTDAKLWGTNSSIKLNIKSAETIGQDVKLVYTS